MTIEDAHWCPVCDRIITPSGCLCQNCREKMLRELKRIEGTPAFYPTEEPWVYDQADQTDRVRQLLNSVIWEEPVNDND